LLEYLESLRRHGKQTFCVHRRGYRTERWPYVRVATLAAQFARELEIRGVDKGDRVLFWGENCAEWVAAFFGCLLRGAVVVPMDSIAAEDFALRVARQVNAKLVICSHEQAASVDGFPLLLFEELAQTAARHPSTPYPAPDVQRSDTVEIIFTSGTTAEPKGVVLTHGNILTNLEPIETEMQKYLIYERPFHPIRFLNLLPLSHVFGQFLSIFVPPLMGGTVLFQPTLNPGEILRTIKRERVSVLVTVPRLLETLKGKLERDAENEGYLEILKKQIEQAVGQSPLRRWWRFRRIHNRFGWKFWAFVCGGAALPAKTENFWQRLGFAVIQGYGLTETTSIVSINHPFKLSRGSIGKVLPGREMKLAEDGEILVRGSGIASGYWQEEKLEPVANKENWFRTGDIGALDEDGNLFFKGRKKNVIVTAEGMNIYPADLEVALRQQEAVRDCVVVEANPAGGPEACAVLLLKSETTDLATILKNTNRTLADYQQIRRALVWPEADFPRTASQKPRLNLIQTWANAQLSGETGSIAGGDTLADLLARITGKTEGGLSAGTRLEDDLNLSSLDRVELLSALEDRYQVEINETRMSTATTMQELQTMLRESAGGRTEYHYPRWTQRWPMTWVRPALYYLLSWPATVLLAWPEVKGREHLRGVKGPMLVISNHIVSADIGFVLWTLTPRLRHRLAVAMEGERLEALRRPPSELGFFSRWIDRISYFLAVGLFNVFPLPQRSGFRESFSFAGESLDRGFSVLVFPEGRRTPDGKMHTFRSGIGLLANRLGVPILPMRIDGLFPLKQARRRFTRPGTIKVTVGEPVRFPPDTDPAEIAQKLEDIVRAL
jgi:long-chain acyl-CoA synthetase